MVKQSTEEGQKEVENMISTLAFDEGIPFLTSKKQDNGMMRSKNRGNNEKDDSDKLEPATIVYHESARSIVFRDDARRIQTGGNLDSSQKNICEPSYPPKGTQKILKAQNLLGLDDESLKSNDSSSKKSRKSRNRHRRRNRKDNLASDSNHSVSSIDTSTHNDGYTSYEDKKGQKPQVVIANFTPEIEPLPALELNAYNEFTELLHSKPYIWNETEGPNEAKVNEQVWNNMNEKEQYVANLLLHGKCVVKTVKKADWTSFLSKFSAKDSPRRYLHPVDLKTATKEERRNKFALNNSEIQSNSFMTSTSLLPSLGLKMRCYGSTKEYCHGVVFALPTNDQQKEDEIAIKTSTWSWPSGM